MCFDKRFLSIVSHTFQTILLSWEWERADATSVTFVQGVLQILQIIVDILEYILERNHTVVQLVIVVSVGKEAYNDIK